MQEAELRKMANEVWSNAATIDGLMRCLDPIIQNVEREVAARYVNRDCVWGEGECIPDCPTCRELDVAIKERSDGYQEGLSDSIQVINTHRMSGYVCSCGEEINSMEGHYEQQIRVLKERG